MKDFLKTLSPLLWASGAVFFACLALADVSREQERQVAVSCGAGAYHVDPKTGATKFVYFAREVP